MKALYIERIYLRTVLLIWHNALNWKNNENISDKATYKYLNNTTYITSTTIDIVHVKLLMYSLCHNVVLLFNWETLKS